MTTDIQKIAKLEYQQRMKERLSGMAVPLDILMMSNDKITEKQVNAIIEQQRYSNRERVPEALRGFSDLYNELTKQEPTKQDLTDWIATFEDWKDKKLDESCIRMAWAQSKDDRKGFTVGRPGALTITAVGMKSKNQPAMTTINTERIEQTQKIIEEKVKLESTFVPMPDDVRARLRAKLATKGR